MPFHVSLHLDDVITGYTCSVAPKVFRAPPNGRSQSIRAEPYVMLPLTRGLARGRRDQRHDCASFPNATALVARIGQAAVVTLPVLAGLRVA